MQNQALHTFKKQKLPKTMYNKLREPKAGGLLCSERRGDLGGPTSSLTLYCLHLKV